MARLKLGSMPSCWRNPKFWPKQYLAIASEVKQLYAEVRSNGSFLSAYPSSLSQRRWTALWISGSNLVIWSFEKNLAKGARRSLWRLWSAVPKLENVALECISAIDVLRHFHGILVKTYPPKDLNWCTGLFLFLVPIANISSIKWGSLQWSSSGLIRTIGPGWF